MKRIILAVVLIAGCSPAMAQYLGGYGGGYRGPPMGWEGRHRAPPVTTPKPTLEERVQQIEYWVEREKRLDAQAERARIDCENARGNNWRRGPDVDPCPQ